MGMRDLGSRGQAQSGLGGTGKGGGMGKGGEAGTTTGSI